MDDFDPDFGMAGPGVGSNALGPSQVLGGASQYLNSQPDVGFSQGDGSDSLNEDIAKLRQSLWNEKAAPEVLQYEDDLVDDLKELVNHQVRFVSFFYFFKSWFRFFVAVSRAFLFVCLFVFCDQETLLPLRNFQTNKNLPKHFVLLLLCCFSELT